MNLFKKTSTYLFLILLLATFLRFWNLGSVPPSASLDEASIGYNAYSVLRTGFDEFKEFPIVSQRGYDDWRRSTYLFLTIPFIKVLGLQVLAIRLPAAILSVLVVLSTYYIVQYLFQKNTKTKELIALFATLLIAISPWHIYISRLGHESNACLSFLVFGILFFLRSEKEKSIKKLFISLFFFVLSLISYYSGQALIPLIVFVLFILYRKTIINLILQNTKNKIAFGIFLLLLIPVFWSVFSPNALVRFQGTSTFKPEAHYELFKNRVELRNKAVANHDIFGLILYNQRLFPVQVFIEGYFSHFKPSWLFTNSFDEPHKVPNMGLLYMWEIPFILLGIFVLISRKDYDGKTKLFLFAWFMFAPLPAALATQAPHAMRTYNILPTWQIFSAIGIVFVISKFQKAKLIVFLILALCAIYSIFSFYKNYFIIFPLEQSKSFQYALAKTIPYIMSIEKNYKKIVFSNKDNLYQSYMFYLYFTRYDPLIYQQQGGSISGGYAREHVIGKYEFRPFILDKEEDKDTLFVGNVKEVQGKASVLKEFSNLDGVPVIQVAIKK